MENNRVFAILAYIGPLFLIGMFAAPQDQKVKFHVNQGLVLFICEIAAGILCGILGVILRIILLGFLASILSWVVSLAGLILTVLGIINAVNDRQNPLPVIGGFTLIK